MIGEIGYGSVGGGFRRDEEREGGKERVVREKGGQRRNCGIVRAKTERKGSLGGTVKVEPTLGDQRDRRRQRWLNFLKDFLEEFIAEQGVHLSLSNRCLLNSPPCYSFHMICSTSIFPLLFYFLTSWEAERERVETCNRLGERGGERKV